MGQKKRGREGPRQKPVSPHQLPPAEEMDIDEIKDIITASDLSDENRQKVFSCLDTLLLVTQELGKKTVSVERLKRMLFGVITETTSKVKKNAEKKKDEKKDEKPEAEKKKPKGHGRNGAKKYTGAETIKVPHEALKSRDTCPHCAKGKLYANMEPERLVRLRGFAPVGGKVYEIEKLRCNLCGDIFSATVPEEVGTEKYDASSAAILALLKYGMGMPFYRMGRLQESLGIPLPSSTQWEIITGAGTLVQPALQEFIRLAAQGEVVHNDDTMMKILELKNDKKDSEDGPGEKPPGRTGVFTSGIISIVNSHKIALFFTGRNHAGENLLKVLKQRQVGLDPPIQMCDALSRNMSEDLKTIVANCVAHARRRFVDVAEIFPDECLFVLELLKEVYTNDATAREQGMTPEERLRFHQEHSQPWMDKLAAWCEEQFDERKVEPNSSLGEAITYLRKHWEKLTLFLRQPGAPLDNNICERAIKKAILHRKNAYFYKTENGARVGDLFMSLIHTCELCGANPFDYLTELQKHADELAAAPQNWMPWNYKETMALPGTLDT